MKLVTDEACRLQSRELFKPNTPYEAERKTDGRVELVELVEKDVPLVRARKVDGRWMGADIKLDRRAVVASIREDRESK